MCVCMTVQRLPLISVCVAVQDVFVKGKLSLDTTTKCVEYRCVGVGVGVGLLQCPQGVSWCIVPITRGREVACGQDVMVVCGRG